jgi:hypothetical protein
VELFDKRIVHPAHDREFRRLRDSLALVREVVKLVDYEPPAVEKLLEVSEGPRCRLAASVTNDRSGKIRRKAVERQDTMRPSLIVIHDPESYRLLALQTNHVENILRPVHVSFMLVRDLSRFAAPALNCI